MKLLFCTLLSALTLFAHEHTDDIKTEILAKVFTNISLNKEIVIWSDNEVLLAEFKAKGIFSTTQKCSNASLIILENRQNMFEECKEKAIFVLNYSMLKEIPQSFGAMFWKKGRPNIVIIAPRTKERAIEVSQKLNEYIEEKIW